MVDLPNDKVLQHIVDVHCHPTDAPYIPPESIEKLQITVCAMSTKPSDQQLVRDLAMAQQSKVIPCFGYHPWFIHQISTRPIVSKENHYRSLFFSSNDPPAKHVPAFEKLLPLLPDPILLNDILSELRSNLEAFPHAMLGEVGLDRIFRIPYDYHATPRELTPFSVPFDHQLVILEAQLDLAVELGRNVSVHSVKAQLPTLDLLNNMRIKHGEKWMNINVDIHSCTLSPETWREIEKRHQNVYLSLSTAINGRSSSYKALIAACSNDRLLTESDFYDIDMCTGRTWDMIKIIAEMKGWDLERDWTDGLDESERGAVHRLEKNWLTFKNKTQRND